MEANRRNLLLSALRCFSTPAIAVGFIASAGAVDQTYQDANPLNTWNSLDANWDAGVIWVNNNNAIFGGTGEALVVGPVVADAITFNSTGYSLGSGTITLGAATTPVTANASATINSVLAFGANTLSTAGAGTLTLGGANTGTGPINVTAGTLKPGVAGALGTSSLVTVSSGATLDVAGLAGGRPVAISGPGAGTAALYNSSIAAGASVGSLKLDDNATIASAVPGADTGKMFGTGALDLNGKKLTITGGAVSSTLANITSGDIDINSGGTLYYTNGGALTTVTGTITVNSGGVLDTRDSNSTTMTGTPHAIVLNGGKLGNGVSTGNNGGGGGALLKNDVTVNNVPGNTFAAVSSGFGLSIRLTGSLSGAGPLAVQNNGAEFRGDVSGYTGTLTSTSSKAIIFNGTANQTFNGILAGTGAVTKTGSFVATLANANIYTGATTVNGGRLILAGNNSLTSGTTNLSGGSTLELDYTDDSRKIPSGALTLNNATIELAGAPASVFADSVASTTLGAASANTISRTSGGATLNFGTVTPGTGSLNLVQGGIAKVSNALNASGVLPSWVTVDSGLATKDVNGFVVAYTGYAPVVRLGSSASTIVDGPTTNMQIEEGSGSPFDILLGSPTTTINSLTQSSIGGASPAVIDPSGGTLATNTILGGVGAGSLTIGNGINNGTLKSAGTSLEFQNVASAGITVNSVIANGTGASSLVKQGAGTLTLAGTNTYTGTTNIVGGTLQFGIANSIAPSGVVMFGGTVDLTGTNQSILGLRSDVASAGIITNSAAGTGTNTLSITGGWWGTYSGAIQNGATAKTALIVSGTNARFSLSGTSNFSGGLTINGAGNTNGADSGVILAIASDAALGATANVVTLNNGGTLFNSNSTTAGWTTGTTPTLAAGRSIVLGSGVGGVFRVYGSTVFTVNSVISGSGALAKTDGGTLALGGTNTYTGVTTVSAGTIRIDNIQALGGFIAGRPATQVVVASGGAVDLNARGATYGYTIAGTGVGGTGALVNSGAAIGNGSAQTSNLKLSANATIGGVNNWALLTNSYNPTSLDLGGFTLTKAGANTIALVSTTTTAGAISVNAGTLAFGVTNGGTGVVGAASSLSLANTAGAALSLARDSSIGSLAGGDTTGGSVALGSSTLTVGGLNANTNLSGAVGGTGAIVKTGSGTQTFSGANTYAGATTINGGTLALDYAAQNNTKLSDTAALIFGPGSTTVSLAGGSHTEIVGSTTLSAGAAVTITRPSGTPVLAMNTITRNAGATVNFTSSGIATTDTLNDASGILPWATVGADYATNSTNAADGLITAYSAYTDVMRIPGVLPETGVIADATTTNVRIVEGTGSTPSDITLGALTTNINTLMQSAVGGTSAATIALPAQTLRLGTFGIVTAVPGSGSLTIGASAGEGILTAGGNTDNVAGGIVIAANSTNPVTLNSVVSNNGSGAVSLVKTGSGTAVLAGTNSFTGPLSIGGGKLNVGVIGNGGAASQVGQSPKAGANLLLNGGTLGYTGATATTDRGFSTGTLGGTFEVPAATTLTFGSVSAAFAFDGTLTKTGAGTLRLTNYTGGTAAAASDIVINQGVVDFGTGYFAGNPFGSQTLTITVNPTGILRTSTAHAFGGSNLNGGSWGQVFVNGGTIEFNGEQYISGGTVSGQGRVVMNGGSIIGTADMRALNSTITTLASTTTSTVSNAGGITLAYGGITFDAAEGAAATDLLVSSAISGPNGVTKTGAGLVVLGGVNTYTGSTSVSAGALELADNARLRFVIPAAGASNKLTGAGTATLKGDFAIDISAAAALTAGTWVLEDAVAGSYESTFSVVTTAGIPWTDAGGNKWTTPGAVSGTVWTFDEATGILTLAAANDYGSWETANGIAGAGAGIDPDLDGILNGIEFVIGGDPSGPGSDSSSLLPTVTTTATHLVFVFRRSDDSAAYDPFVEYGSNLTGWTLAEGGVNGVTILEEDDAFGTDIDRVTVSIPRALEVGAKMFARLRVDIP